MSIKETSLNMVMNGNAKSNNNTNRRSRKIARHGVSLMNVDLTMNRTAR